MSPKPLSARQSLYLIIVTVAVYALWEIISHQYLMHLPMATWHWVSGGIGTLIALTIAAVATRAILAQEHRLEDLIQLKDDLTRLVIHDLRAPLMATIGALETIKTGYFGKVPEKAQEMVDIALDGNRALVYMINDLQDIAAMEEGQSILNLTETEVRPMVEAAVDVVEPMAKVRETTLSIEVEHDIPRIRLDSGKMRRVITNLLTNAVKFSHSGAWIDLRVRWDRPRRRLLISVADTGEGIPLEYHKKIFDKFFRVKTEQGDRQLSTGLGLTFCKMIVEAHGGTIRVESEVGKGSTFTVEIPA